MKAVWQELGTSRGIPPRSFLGGAAMRKEKPIHEMTARLIFGAMLRGGPNYREFREALHLMKAVGHELKKVWDDFIDDDKDDRDK